MEEVIKYIYKVWGNEGSLDFYKDAIIHSSLDNKSIPEFYVLTKQDNIIGCVYLIRMDFISRQDLYPWLAGLYINEDQRRQGYANILMKHVEKRCKEIGFDSLYLTTDHDGYYERYNWTRIQDGIDLFSGNPARIYKKDV
jgi:N-acetylglutamate synthase-like GNAT family acetyltransferase